MDSMLTTVWLILGAMSFGAMMDFGGFNERLITPIIHKVKSDGGTIATVMLTSIGFNIVAGDQYIAIVLPARMFMVTFRQRGLHPETLATAVENSGTVTSPLVPWNSCGAYMSATLGVSTFVYFPYCFFNLLNPILGSMLVNILYIILAILIATTLYVVVQTALYARRQGEVPPAELVPVDTAAVADHLAAAVRCQTVPLDDTGTPDPAAFRQLHRMLAETYPLVHQKLIREVINGYSLLYTWQGSRADPGAGDGHGSPGRRLGRPGDAGPVDLPAVRGLIADGFIWGRGTLDIKNQLIGIMDAAEILLAGGYRPERTILFGLGHDEETGGVNGCRIMGQYLKERGIHLAGIVDEGGGISDGLVPGVRGLIALVGSARRAT
jgi:hypothetical protein